MTIDEIPNNIPPQLVSFIGREQEVAEVTHLLACTRLVSLVGTGGIGKSRLALQVARHVAEIFPDGIWFAELASLSDATLLYHALASTMSLQEEKNVPIVTTLCRFLATKKALLILDNCEHLVARCAVSAETLLHACPTLFLLVTSREALNIGAETIFTVPPLSLPPLAEKLPPTTAKQFEAVHLFLERARSLQPHFILNDSNIEAVVQVCREVEGIPLALELATARLSVMPIEQIAIRLKEQLGAHMHLLNKGTRTAPLRQQTLRATLDWSYKLLSPQEQRLLQRFAIFVGGWTLEAAEVVCMDQKIAKESVLDLLGQLVSKSLVVVSEEATLTNIGDVAFLHARYRLLEPVRHYAYEKLQARGEEQKVQKRHLDYFLALAQQADRHIRGREQLIWLQYLDNERDNLRAAFTYALQTSSGTHGLQLASALAWYWVIRTYFSEGSKWLQDMLALSKDGNSHSRATALYRAGVLAWCRSDFQQLAEYSEQSLTLFSALGDKQGIGCSLSNLVEFARWRGEYQKALQVGEDAVAALQDAGDTWTIAFTYLPLSVVLRQQDKMSEAILLVRKGLSLFRIVGDKWGLAAALNLLGVTLSNSGETAQAIPYLRESVSLFQTLGDKNGEASVLYTLGLTLLRQRSDEAYHFITECKGRFKELGNLRFLAQLLLDEGQIVLQQSYYERAIDCFEECLVLSQSNEDARRTGIALYFLGVIAMQQWLTLLRNHSF